MRGRAFVELEIMGLDRKPAPRGHRIPGVGSEVYYDLLELSKIGLDPADVRSKHSHQVDILADQPSQEALDVLDHRVQVEHLGIEHLLAAEGQELADQAS